MIRKVSLLVVSLLVAFLAIACMTAAVWAETAVPNSPTNQHLEVTLRSNATSDPRVLAFQSAANNSAQAANRLKANNTTRIIIPTKIENASSTGAQPFNGLVLPTGLVIAATILILLVVLAYLFLRLLHEGTSEPSADTRPVGPTVQSTSEPRRERPRQIPIDEAETEVERKNRSLVGAESRRVSSIPIDAEEERREPEDNSK